jgi:hypothetical protein
VQSGQSRVNFGVSRRVVGRLLARARRRAWEDPFATGIMYACMSWVACCMERPGQSVAIQPFGDGVYEADVTLMGGDHKLLRVEYRIEYGLVLRWVVEPLRP